MPTSRAKRLPNPGVSDLIALLAEAYGRSAHDIADEISRASAAPHGGDSDPTRETITSYVKTNTPLRHKFAHLVVNYMDGRRPDNQTVPVPEALRNSNDWRRARLYCTQVLALPEERERRYEKPLGSDPGTQSAIASLAGLYATYRFESSDADYHQEILILNNDGTKSAPRCHCTYVTAHGVTRGEWLVVGDIVYCGLSGFSEDNRHDVAGLYLARLGGPELLSGLLAGTGTNLKLPVAMPIVALKVPAPSKSILALGDLGDTAILKAFRQVKEDFVESSPGLREILAAQMKPFVFDAKVSHPRLRRAFESGSLTINQSFLEFSKSTVS